MPRKPGETRPRHGHGACVAPWTMKLSACGRFVIVEALYIDRNALGALATWAAEHGLGAQDAIQIAILAFNDTAAARPEVVPLSVRSSPTVARGVPPVDPLE